MIGQSLRDLFVESVSIRGERKAISFLRDGVIETEMTYEGLNRDSNRVANSFLNLGVQKGDRVILCLEKSLFFVVAHLAVQKIGAISVPLNPGFRGSEMSYLLNDADPKLAISGPSQAVIVKDIAPLLTSIVIHTERPYQDLDFFLRASDAIPQAELKPEDPGLLIYTSGTTGEPKGALLTQGNLVHDARNIITIWEISESDLLCHVLPLFHVHGLCFALHTALTAGSHLLMLDAFSPEKVIEVLSRKEGKYPSTLFMAVPTIYGKLMDYLGDRRPDFGHMRLWTSGSAPLLVKDFDRMSEVFGKEPVEREGMSETGMNFSNPITGIRKPGSIGLPLPGLEVRIVDLETFEDVTPGQEGEIWLRGPGVSPGYWRKPEETARAFKDGWFRTGDLGKVDGDGYYYLTDRIKHIIISGGENISPKEVETVIDRIEGVVESCVVGVPDPTWGEKVVAAVVKTGNSPVKTDDIQEYCKENLQKWKCPKEIIFVEELPKNRMGKVLKKEVKELFCV
ncbi:MAG: class I adenylate-forming enzyme family protein [Desulfatiglandaceae bacterium]